MKKSVKIAIIAGVVLVGVGTWALSSKILNSATDYVDSKLAQVKLESKEESEKEEETYEEISLSEDENWKGSYEDSIVAKARGEFTGLESVDLSSVGYSFTKDEDGNTGVVLDKYTMYYDSHMSFVYMVKVKPFTEEEKAFLDPSGGAFFTFYEEDGKYIFTSC